MLLLLPLALSFAGRIAANPAVTTQPVSQSATVGATVSLSVAATGTGSLHYQWRKLGTPISGASAAELTIPGVAMADAGGYDVLVTDDAGTTTSRRATLAVGPIDYGTTFRLDPTFAPLIERTGGDIRVLALSLTGQSYVGGGFTLLDGVARDGFALLTSGAVLDAGFNATLRGSAQTMVYEPSGTLVVGGSFTEVNGVLRAGLARLGADGASVDPVFALPTGWDTATLVARQPDGKLLVVASLINGTVTETNLLLRLNPDGTPDPVWPTDRAQLLQGAYALAVQPDGKIIAGGYTDSFAGHTEEFIVRLNADGTRDTSFVSGAHLTNVVRALALQPDGKIVVGGAFEKMANGTPSGCLVRLNADGSLDTTFAIGSGFTSASGTGVDALLLQPDGRIVVAGQFSALNGSSAPYLVRLLADGTRDTTFPGTYVPNGPVRALAYDSAAAQIVVAGAFDRLGASTPVSGLARFGLSGTLATVNAAGGRVGGWVTAAVPTTGGDWVVAGDFTHINGVARGRIARLNADGTLDATFATGAGFNAPVSALARTGDGRLIAGGKFTSFNGAVKNRLVGLNADSSVDTTFAIGTGCSADVKYVVVQGDGRVVVSGDFTTYNGATAKWLTRLNPNGTRDTTFSTWVPNFFSPLGLQVDDQLRILAGTWWYADATYSGWRFALRLTSSGTPDPTFHAQAATERLNSGVSDFAVQPDGKFIVGGFFSAYGTMARMGLARFNPDGSFDPSYGPVTENCGLPGALNLLPDGSLLATGYMKSLGRARHAIRYLADGNPDPSFVTFDQFGAELAVWGSGSRPAYMDDGRLLIPGLSGWRGAHRQFGLCVLRPEASPAVVITGEPTPQVVAIGGTATFAVAATGEGTIRYQWRKGGALLAGATGTTLVVAGAQLTDAGSYSVVVENEHAQRTSAAVTLTVHEEAVVNLAEWAASVFTPSELGDPAVSGPNADPGATGVPNLMRYAFDLPPPGTPQSASVVQVAMVPEADGDHLEISFDRKSYAEDLTYVVEATNSMAGPWTTLAEFAAGYPQHVTVTDSVSTSATRARFIRVRVVLAP